MDTHKKFFIYFLLVVAFFIFSQIMIYFALQTTYKYKSVNIKTTIPIEIEVQATLVNGFAKGKVKNNSEETLENKYIQAILGGMKPSIIGIIIGIGLYMILQNCNLNKDYNNIDIRSVIMTIVLLIVYYGSRKVLKKGLTPIKLIIISAITGIIAYSL